MASGVTSGTAPAAVPLFSGVVLTKGNRDPLPGIHVTVVSAAASSAGTGAVSGAGPTATDTASASPPQEAVTDAAGRFAIAGLRPGPSPLLLAVTLSGQRIVTVHTSERLTAGRRLQVTYYVLPKSSAFEAVVRGEPIRKEVVEQVLTSDEVRRIAGNQNDTIKAVQNLPGVARAPFGSGLLVVWGSAPGDTRVYADGLYIPTLYHFGGLRSTINSEFVEELAFRPGGYGADYGRGLGGMIDITTRSPKQDKIHGSVTLDLIDGSATIEGPITKKLYFAIGARVSWISIFLPIFNRSNFQVSPFYWDFQAALSYRPTKRDDLDLFIFGSTDNLSLRVQNPDPNESVDVNSDTSYARARLRWTHRFDKDNVLTLMPSIGYDTTSVNTGQEGVGGNPFNLDLNTLSVNLRGELRHRFSSILDTAIGIDMENNRTTLDIVSNAFVGGGGGGGFGGGMLSTANDQALQDTSTVTLVQTAPYVIGRLFLFDKRLLISPQLRLETTYVRDYDGSVSRWLVLPEPRLLVSYQIVPKLAIKGSVGVYHEPPTGTELTRSFGNPNLYFEFETAYVVGFDLDPTRTLHIEAQGFYKDLRNLVVPDPTLTFDNGGIGRAYGGEILIRQKLWHNFFGWLAYTLSRSERKDRPEDPWYLFSYDQTHILTLIASYKLPFGGLEVGARFRYVTGDPYTPTVGGIRNVSTQVYQAVLGERNTARLPAFNQLDLRIDKTIIFNRWKLGIFLDIQNLYNEQNAEALVYGGRQLYQDGRVTGIPIFPDLGVRADF